MLAWNEGKVINLVMTGQISWKEMGSHRRLKAAKHVNDEWAASAHPEHCLLYVRVLVNIPHVFLHHLDTEHSPSVLFLG